MNKKLGRLLMLHVFKTAPKELNELSVWMEAPLRQAMIRSDSDLPERIQPGTWPR